MFDDASWNGILSSFASIPHIRSAAHRQPRPVVPLMRITGNLCRILKRHPAVMVQYSSIILRKSPKTPRGVP